MPNRHSFPIASVEQLRSVSAGFSRHTAQSLDGIHPRQVTMLPDVALEGLAAIYEAVESLGMFPSALYWMLFRLWKSPREASSRSCYVLDRC